MSSTLTNLTAATTWSGTDLFYALVGGNSRKIAASSFWICDAANVLSDVNSTTAQTVRVYRTFTDSSNYERLALQSGSGYFEVAAQTGGTGTDNINLRLTASGTGSVLVLGTGGFGYGTGAGSTYTQTTSKGTFVAVTTPCGQITMHNQSIGAGSAVAFSLSYAAIAAGDVVVINHGSGGTPFSYRIDVGPITAGNSASVLVTNTTGGALGEAIVLNYAIIRGATS